jgi:hypothetical protein
VDPVIPQDVIREETREEEKKPDGTIVSKTTRKTTVQTADIALSLVFVLCLVLFVMAIFIDSMREGLNGALPYLLGLFALAIGGVEAYRVATGKNKDVEPKPKPV